MSGPSRVRKPRSGALVGVLIGVVLTLLVLELVEPAREAVFGEERLVRIDEAEGVISSSYFRATDQEELEDAAIEGMVRDLRKRHDDRFSYYFDPEANAAHQASIEGQFSGIGVTVSEVKRGLEVAQVFDGAPAENASIDVGDLIVAVEGESLTGVPADVAAEKIKGPAGTSVRLTVVDGKTGRKREIEVERDNVNFPVVAGRMLRRDGRQVGHVVLSSFTRGAHGQLSKEIERLRDEGAEGFLFDLRGNPGGLVEEAVLVTSLFQEEGPVLTISGRNRPERTLEVTGETLGDLGPIAILVDRNTASAAEVVTAALKENDLASVVGTRTYGKGVYQELIPLSSGGALDLTVGEYLTADGSSILGTGVKPDVRVADRDPADGDSVLDAGLRQLLRQLDGRG